MNVSRLQLLAALFLLALGAKAQQPRLDSLLEVEDVGGQSDAEHVRTLTEIADAWANVDPRKGIEVAKEAQALAVAQGDREVQVRTLLAERYCYFTLWDFGKADSVNQLAEVLARKGRDQRLLATALGWSYRRNDPAARWLNMKRWAEADRIGRKLGDTALLARLLFINSYLNMEGDSMATAFRLYQAMDDSLGMAMCYTVRSTGFEPFISDPEGSIRDLTLAIGIFERGGYLIFGTWALQARARLYTEKGLLDRAMADMVEALRQAEQINQPDIASLYNNVGELYQRLGEAPTALSYHRKGLAAAQATTRKLSNLNNMGAAYMQMNRPDSALLYLRRAEAIEARDRSGVLWAGTQGRIGQALLQQGDTVSALLKLDTAWAGVRGVPIAADLELSFGLSMGRALQHGSDKVLRAMGLTKPAAQTLARQLFLRTLELARAKHMLLEERDALLALSGWYTRNGDPKTALGYMGSYTLMKDSIFSVDKARAIGKLHMQYLSEKKEQEIQLLGKEKEVQAKEIQKQRIVVISLFGGFILVLLFALVFFRQRNRISREMARSEELLLNILPEKVAEELKSDGVAEAVQFDGVTVLFTDFKGFTAMSEIVTPKQLVRDLNECFSAFDRIAGKYGIEKIKTIGDAYMAVGGLPTPNTTHAKDVIHAAFEMREFIAVGKARKIAAGLPYFEIRIGIHTGPVVAGIVGLKKFQYDIWGDTVNTASRMESSGEAGKVNISEATYERVKNDPGFTFAPRGKVKAKGKGEMEMYFVERAVS